MARLIVTPNALVGLQRCRGFLAGKDPVAARRAAEAIRAKFAAIAAHPMTGRPFEDQPDLREVSIPFGDSGYVALYRHVADEDLVVVLAFRHQREAGY